MRKKRSSLVGAFVSTHGKSIDEVDRTIVEARTSLNEVTQELQERVHRWKQIEYLCGFNIIQNMGLQSLENSLYRGLNGRPFGLLKGKCLFLFILPRLDVIDNFETYKFKHIFIFCLQKRKRINYEIYEDFYI